MCRVVGILRRFGVPDHGDGWIEALKALVTARFPAWKPSWNRQLESVSEPIGFGNGIDW